MRAEQHYDEEVLVSFVDSPDAMKQDAHLASCATCRESLEAYRETAEILADAAVWNEQQLSEAPNPATIATLRAFADRLGREEAEAEAVLAEMLRTSRESWLPQIEAHPEWRTVGMVRRLIKSVERAVQTMPPDAVELGRVATAIADAFDRATYDADVIDKTRGAAWRTYAYALHYSGDIVAALSAVETAEDALAGCLVADYDAARVAVVRAYVLRSLEETGAALEGVAKSAAVFDAHGDKAQSAIAAFAYAYVLLKEHQYRPALEIFQRLLRETTDPNMPRLLHHNVGFCHRELGEFEPALQQYQIALEAFRETGSASLVARAEWNIAGVLLAAGRVKDAYPRLIAARETLASLGMHNEAALANLELAEVLLAQERYDEIDTLCGEVMRYYEGAGLAYGRHAMAALAYMQEAARARKATVQLVRNVRYYVTRLPEQPNLLFLDRAF